MQRLISWFRDGLNVSSRPAHRSKARHVHVAPALLEAPILQARELVRSFGDGETRTVAVRDVSLELYRGQLALLMGPSGSGKSTLLALLSGLMRPDEGRVSVLDRDLWSLSEQQQEGFRLRHFGFIFQGYNLFPALTAR